MPEGIEVEYYRRAAEAVVGRVVAGVSAPDRWYLKGDTTQDVLAAVLVGAEVCAARRIGKLLLLDTDRGHTLGLRFGMTGRLLVDGSGPIDHLEYSSHRNDPSWDRFGLRFRDGTELALRDPRRLGGAELDPDESALGFDVFTVTAGQLGRLLGASSASLKARLMDQRQLAGLGNLLTDEILWRASLHPLTPSAAIDGPGRRRLHRHLRTTLAELAARGGSHTGDLQEQRQPGGHCPRDGANLQKLVVGGRTTYACGQHQRLSTSSCGRDIDP